jgi:Domain of unknown function (DUF1707)
MVTTDTTERNEMRYRWDPAYPNGGRRMSFTGDGHLRASDAERNEVAERLSRHFADGRLDEAEFRARLDRVMGATTRGDLDGLFDDLPRLTDQPEPRPRRHRLASVLLLVLLVAVAATWTYPFVHVPWVLLVILGVVFWHRAGRHAVRPVRD